MASVLDGIRVRLVRRGTRYAAVFDALLALAGAKACAGEVSDDDIRKEDDPSSLDAAWEEQPAFGPAATCAAGAQPGDAVIRFHPRASQPRTLPTLETGGA